MTYLHVLINPQALPLNPSTAEWFRPCKCPEQDWGSFLFFFIYVWVETQPPADVRERPPPLLPACDGYWTPCLKMQRMECGCVEDLSAHELVRCSKAIRQRVSLPPTLQENHAHCGDERLSLIPVMYSPPDGGGKLSCGRAPILVCCLSEYHGLSQVAVKGGVPAPLAFMFYLKPCLGQRVLLSH